MAFRNLVLASKKEVFGLYKYDDDEQARVRCQNLIEMGLIPFTGATLETEIGQAFVSLAAWVYFSGELGRNYSVSISGDPDFLEELVQLDLSPLKNEEYTKSESGLVDLRETRLRILKESRRLAVMRDTGATGRLMYTLGLEKPNGEDRENRATKKHYHSGLPSFVKTLIEYKPRREIGRKDALHRWVKVLLTDRWIQSRNASQRKHTAKLHLRKHISEDAAREHGEEIVDLLNSVYHDNHYKGIFGYEQVRVKEDKGQKSHQSEVLLTNEQIGFIATKNFPNVGAPLLTVKPRYL